MMVAKDYSSTGLFRDQYRHPTQIGFDPIDRRAWLCARLFLLVGLPVVVALSLIIVPFGVPDEPAHFLRAAAISEGHLFPEVGVNGDHLAKERRAAGATVNEAVAAFAATAYHATLFNRQIKASMPIIRHEFSRTITARSIFAAHSNTAIYPPLIYLPTASGLFIAHVLRAPPIAWLYIGRLIDGIVAVILFSWAIGRAREAAPSLLVLAASPICLFQAAGVTTDALLFPAAAVFAATLTRLSAGEALSTRERAFLIGSTLLLGIGKVAYMPLVALPPLALFVCGGGGEFAGGNASFGADADPLDRLGGRCTG